MNTALLLKTSRWDLPVELSGHVYRALQKVESLGHVYIRLDGGPAPKPAPRSSGPLSYYPPPPLVDAPLPNDPPSGIIIRSSGQKRKKGYSSTFWADKRAFSGFTKLQTLEITQLTSLEGLLDLRECIKACSSSLRSLTLTVNSRFGSKAQRSSVPPPPNDYDSLSDTEPDNDEYLDAANPNAPELNEADRRQEKMALEGLLANLFDLQGTAARAQKLERKMGLAGGKCLIESDKSQTLKLLENAFSSMHELDASKAGSSQSANLRVAKIKMVKELAELYISQHTLKTMRHGRAEAKSTSKKVLKPSKYPPPSYPPPGMPDEDALALENFNFEEFLDANGHVSSPGSFDSPIGSSNTKPWPSAQSKYSPNDPIYIDEPLPHLHAPNTMGSSLNPSTTSINADLQAFSPALISPFSNAVQPPINVKSTSTKGLEYLPYNTPHQPYSLHPEIVPKYTGKAPKIKYKPYPKHSSKSPVPDSVLYDGAPGSTKKNFGISNSAGFMSSKPVKISGHPISDIHKKYNINSSSSGSSTVSDDESDLSPVTATPPGGIIFKAGSNDAQMDDGPDVDMEHPDLDDMDFNEDQESVSSDSSQDITRRKRTRPSASAFQVSVGKTGESHPESQPPAKDSSREANETMHEYIRVTHGIQLEVLRLQYVPMKASILGRALDLRAVQRITLLETGPQDAFWALLIKLTDPEAPIMFKSIHTDHISMALLKYLSGYVGLEELFLHERRSKKKESDSGIEVDITSIRRQALRPHIRSLKRLMLRNERSDCWDFDFKTVHMLATQAKNLKEMAISLKTIVYHGFLQILPAFQSLEALHLISLRGGDRNTSLQLESLAFSVDSLVQCAEVKLRYIAISERVTEINGQAHFRKQLKNLIDGSDDQELRLQVDKKGKGKAVEPDRLLQEVTSDQELDSRLARLQAAQRRLRIPRRFDDIDNVKIFSYEVRTGRL